MNSRDLCKWLRDNSSGIYRPASEAADKIERQQELLELAWDAICEAGYECYVSELRRAMDCES